METCTAPPELRWPNEGFVGGTNRKRLCYDDMSIPQWVVGQLNNMSQIKPRRGTLPLSQLSIIFA